LPQLVAVESSRRSRSFALLIFTLQLPCITDIQVSASVRNCGYFCLLPTKRNKWNYLLKIKELQIRQTRVSKEERNREQIDCDLPLEMIMFRHFRTISFSHFRPYFTLIHDSFQGARTN
jgi:hypothetical protein